MRRGSLGLTCAALTVIAGLSACGTSGHAGLATATSASPTARSASPDARTPSNTTPSNTTPTGSRPTPAPPGRSTSRLPRGGTKIIGHLRVVAYYGAAGAPALGVLGQSSPEHAAQQDIERAAGYTDLGLPVQPAMELLATVAQGSPGPDGMYSAPVPHAVLERYLRVAHEHKMLLILDLQPGEASFLSQAEQLRGLLLDPSVSLALDPEWKVGPGEAPGGGRIGSSSAAGVNAVSSWLSHLVRADHLPDKLLVVHEFTPSMLPDRSNIVRRPGVEVSFHADGFGSPRVKRGVFRQLAFHGHPWGVGFKLFLTQDSRLMTPQDVLTLRPRPDIITYQ